MAITYQDIRSERQWRSSTGLTEIQFFKLAALFSLAYEEMFGESLTDRQNTSTASSTFQTYEALLFFGLYSIKSGLTYDLLGLSFNLSPSNAYEMQALSLTVIQSALELGGYMPLREYTSEEEFKEHWKEEGDIMVDATEQRRQRPGNQEAQKQDYSGKKKRTP